MLVVPTAGPDVRLTRELPLAPQVQILVSLITIGGMDE